MESSHDFRVLIASDNTLRWSGGKPPFLTCELAELERCFLDRRVSSLFKRRCNKIAPRYGKCGKPRCRFETMMSEPNKSGPISHRAILSVVGLLVIGRVVLAVPCALPKSHPDSWVTTKVNVLVQAARAAYEDDVRQPAYDRVVNGIADTLRQCKLSEDESFAKRYRQFVEYIKLASVAQLPDHELGFMVPDRQYFQETRQYVQIPEFLLTQTFLRSVSRDETLN